MHIIIALLCIGLLIFVHELGHFIVARLCGVQVNRFAIGFPPKLISFTRKGITYALNAIPLGGYVSIKGFGAADEAEDAQDSRGVSFQEVSFIKQICIVLAGIFANVLLAYVIFVGLFLKGFSTPLSQVNENMMPYVQNPYVQIAGVVEKSPAQNAGLQFGDKLISISDARQNRVPLSAEGISNALTKSNGGDLTFEVNRANEKQHFVVTSAKDNEGVYRVGLMLDTYGTVKVNFLQSFKVAAVFTAQNIHQIFSDIGLLFSKESRGDLTVSGPIGIIRDTGTLVSYGIQYLLWYLSLLSLNLAVLNILPIPPLDGWHAVKAVYKKITKRNLPVKVESIITAVGVLMVVALLVFATVGDIKSFF